MKSIISLKQYLWIFIEIIRDIGLMPALSILKTKILKRLYRKIKPERLFPKVAGNSDYRIWIEANHPRVSDYLEMANTMSLFHYKPLISLIMPVYNPPILFFKEAMDSVINQIYQNWELCLADDASTNPEVKDTIEYYRKLDSRIRVEYRTVNGHISEASNTSIGISKGEFIALLDQDDLLTRDALYHAVFALNADSTRDMLYSDEDKINLKGELFSPFFKPDWSPESYLSRNYTCHFSVYRKTIINQINGFRKGLEGSQDYDLMLRFSEKTNSIHHIPRILYHWRAHQQSTSLNAAVKNYASHSAEIALKDALIRRGELANVEPVRDYAGNFNVRYKLKQTPLISIIIPSKNQVHFLAGCLTSIFNKTTYSNFEIILVDNGTDDSKAIEILKYWTNKEPIRFRWLKQEEPFNFSKLINFGSKMANGEYLVLLNNDIEVISSDWIESLLSQAQNKEIGAVGCLLLYENKTVQHAGVILGIGGIANHAMVGESYQSNRNFCYLRLTNNVSAVTGACMMVSLSKFLEAGGLDENLAVSFNDIDFCLKLGKLGYRNLYLPYVKLFHFESKSRGNNLSSEKMAKLVFESDQMLNRWGPMILDDPYYNRNLTRSQFDFSLKV